MSDIPLAIMTVIRSFAPPFLRRIFMYVRLLLVGAILAPSKRTVTAVPCVIGKGAEAYFQNDHCVRNPGPMVIVRIKPSAARTVPECLALEGPRGHGD